MAVYRRSTRHRFTLAVLVLSSITLLTLDFRGAGSGVIGAVKSGARDAFAPVQDATQRLFAPVGDVLDGVVNHGDLEAENARLRRQLAEREGQLLRAEDADRERRALLELQGLTFAGNLPRLSARVVSATPSNFEVSVEIDRGSRGGVATGMPVVTGAGLIGRVTEVSSRRATVLLVTDRGSSVGVRLSSTGELGVAQGGGPRSPLAVDLVDPGVKVEIGEIVVTSGLQDSFFPAGVPVGKVDRARHRPGALQQDVTIDPVVDLRRLSFVTVLQWSPHG